MQMCRLASCGGSMRSLTCGNMHFGIGTKPCNLRHLRRNYNLSRKGAVWPSLSSVTLPPSSSPMSVAELGFSDIRGTTNFFFDYSYEITT